MPTIFSVSVILSSVGCCVVKASTSVNGLVGMIANPDLQVFT